MGIPKTTLRLNDSLEGFRTQKAVILVVMDYYNERRQKPAEANCEGRVQPQLPVVSSSAFVQVALTYPHMLPREFLGVCSHQHGMPT